MGVYLIVSWFLIPGILGLVKMRLHWRFLNSFDIEYKRYRHLSDYRKSLVFIGGRDIQKYHSLMTLLFFPSFDLQKVKGKHMDKIRKQIIAISIAMVTVFFGGLLFFGFAIG
jgi:hypothetical protein